MAMALGDVRRAIGFGDAAAGLEFRDSKLA